MNQLWSLRVLTEEQALCSLQHLKMQTILKNPKSIRLFLAEVGKGEGSTKSVVLRV